MSPNTFGKILKKLKKHNNPSREELIQDFNEELNVMDIGSLFELIEHLTISVHNTPEWILRKVIIKKIIAENKTNRNTLMKLNLLLSRSSAVGLLDIEHVLKIREIIMEEPIIIQKVE